MNHFDADGRDPGLAAERTDLAWNRSGLSLLACGAAVMRGLAHPPLDKGNVAVGAAILGLAAITWALGAWHAQRSGARRRAAVARDLWPISLGVALVGLAAFGVAALFPS
jgi:uncharacterized membrane protein YidH (DUF202 family)